jgi:hypothetical protein
MAVAWSRQRSLLVRAGARRKNEMQSLQFTRRDADRRRGPRPRPEPDIADIGTQDAAAPTGMLCIVCADHHHRPRARKRQS